MQHLTLNGQNKIDSPLAVLMQCWLLPCLLDHISSKILVGEGFFGVAGGDWGRQGVPQQHRQQPADPPSPDSTDPKVSAFFKVTSTSSRSSKVRTLYLIISYVPCRNSTKTPATSFKEPPLPFTPPFWEWAAPSTTITRWSLIGSWSWFSESQEICFQASCPFCQLCCQTCPYQTCPFQHCYQLSSGNGFRSSLQTP